MSSWRRCYFLHLLTLHSQRAVPHDNVNTILHIYLVLTRTTNPASGRFLDVTTTVIPISVSLPETCYIVLVGLLCGLSLVLAFNLPTRWHSRNHLIPPAWGRVTAAIAGQTPLPLGAECVSTAKFVF